MLFHGCMVPNGGPIMWRPPGPLGSQSLARLLLLSSERPFEAVSQSAESAWQRKRWWRAAGSQAARLENKAAGVCGTPWTRRCDESCDSHSLVFNRMRWREQRARDAGPACRGHGLFNRVKEGCFFSASCGSAAAESAVSPGGSVVSRCKALERKIYFLRQKRYPK